MVRKTLCLGAVGVPLWLAWWSPAHERGDLQMRLISEDNLAVVTICQEAAGESYLGKLAVAEVIRNRMQQKYQSDGTVSGTVLKPAQFSGWNTNAPGRIRDIRLDDEDLVVRDAILAWHEAKAGSNTVHGAVLYYAPATLRKLSAPMPYWDDPHKTTKVAVVGLHHFFTDNSKSAIAKV